MSLACQITRSRDTKIRYFFEKIQNDSFTQSLHTLNKHSIPLCGRGCCLLVRCCTKLVWPCHLLLFSVCTTDHKSVFNQQINSKCVQIKCFNFFSLPVQFITKNGANLCADFCISCFVVVVASFSFACVQLNWLKSRPADMFAL